MKLYLPYFFIKAFQTKKWNYQMICFLANQKLYTIVMITQTKENQQQASKVFKKTPILLINTHFHVFKLKLELPQLVELENLCTRKEIEQEKGESRKWLVQV
jgi:hypothetical protein